MKNKKKVLSGMIGLIVSVSCNAENNLVTPVKFAAINFSEVTITEPTTKPKKKPKSRSINREIIKPERKQYEIEGYLNNNQAYVRMVLEMENEKYVVGNMYDKSGKETYIHGEYVDGALHVYDKKGKHFTIVIDSKKP
jgi:hypothetical protein